MDTDRIEMLGATPIAQDLAKVSQITNSADFLRTLGQLEVQGIGGLFSAAIYTDHMKSDENIIYLSQAGLSLPDEAYYREDQHQSIRDAFLTHVEKMFALAGIPAGSAHAARILFR